MLEYLIEGGYLMFPLMLCSVVAISVIIDRVRAFRLADSDTFRLRADVSHELEAGRIDEAIDACRRYRGPVAAVFLAGLAKFRRLAALGRDTTEIELNVAKTMEDYAPHVLESLEKRMNLLTLVGSIAPLLGMTGTVTGMIKAFNKMAAEGVSGGAVAAGISEALITTAAGLLIALPAVVAYNVMSKRVDRFNLEIEETIAELIDFISLKHRER